MRRSISRLVRSADDSICGTRATSPTWAAAFGATVTALVGLAGGLALAGQGGEPPKNPPAPQDQAAASAVSVADQFQGIIKEYDDDMLRRRERSRELARQREVDKAQGKVLVDQKKALPDPPKYYQDPVCPYARRISDLVLEHPEDPAGRDALIWIVNRPGQADWYAYGDEFSRAVNLLVTFHADDPETARLGLTLNKNHSRNRDAFIEGVYANAKGREAKGLARLALARYLEGAVQGADYFLKYPDDDVLRYRSTDDKGKATTKTFTTPNLSKGYYTHLRLFDTDKVRREAERLYEEVIAEYADIPYVTTHHRDLERRAQATPIDAEGRASQQRIKETLKKKLPTLGEVAQSRLDEMRNLAVGKPAPDFEGVGADGKPVKLSDFRGKVVVMDFWFATCGPCLREIPSQRDLTEAMKGRPFTFLGIVTDGRNDDARGVIQSRSITWPNVLEGGEAVAERYHVEGYPTHVVIDARGVIRAKSFDVADSHPFLDPLVKEAEAAVKN